MAVSVEAWIRNLGPLLNNSVAAVGSIRTPDTLSLDVDALQLALAGSWKHSVQVHNPPPDGHVMYWPHTLGMAVPEGQTWLVRSVFVSIGFDSQLGARLQARAGIFENAGNGYPRLVGDNENHVSVNGLTVMPSYRWEGLAFCPPGTAFGLYVAACVDSLAVMQAMETHVEYVPFPVMT